MPDKSIKPEAVLEHRQGQNVIGMTSEILAQTPDFVDHSTEAQAGRLLVALRCNPVSTIEAAKYLDIVHPPSTVRYLRGKGYVIHTRWTYKATEVGRKPHRVGEYVLIHEAA